jgi:uncharacterized membrane protein YdjX (TVP38/TMEM64 family)
MADWFNAVIEGLVSWTGLTGLTILFLTVPLAVIQGFLGLYPFSTVIFIHISALGVVEGLAASWLSGALSAILVYLVCKFLFADRILRRWGHRLERYEKWQHSFDRYGIWAVILLRTIPVMPNNLISFMSAVSPIRTSSYIWSSLLGNLSHIWLFGIISSSLLFPGMDIGLLLGTYLAFCACLLAVFAGFRVREFRQTKQDKGTPTVL